MTEMYLEVVRQLKELIVIIYKEFILLIKRN